MNSTESRGVRLAGYTLIAGVFVSFLAVALVSTMELSGFPVAFSNAGFRRSGLRPALHLTSYYGRQLRSTPTLSLSCSISPVLLFLVAMAAR